MFIQVCTFTIANLNLRSRAGLQKPFKKCHLCNKNCIVFFFSHKIKKVFQHDFCQNLNIFPIFSTFSVH